ncbi:hypothetical protein LguiA_023662 [Lonicera macranthoides]
MLQRQLLFQVVMSNKFRKSTAKTIQCPALPLQGINYVHSGDRLPPRMLGVGNSIANHILQKDLEYTSGFFIDETADPLHSTSSRQPPNCRLCNPLNVVTEDLTVPFCTSLSQPFSTFSTPRHFYTFFKRILIVIFVADKIGMRFDL